MPGADLYQANLVNAHAAAQNSAALNGDVYPQFVLSSSLGLILIFFALFSVNQSMIHGTPTASRNASMFTGNFILFLFLFYFFLSTLFF